MSNDTSGSLFPDALQSGLTKREYFAGLALMGLRGNAHPQCPTTSGEIAEMAVADADALLAELAK
jgi:hypothetical protein